MRASVTPKTGSKPAQTQPSMIEWEFAEEMREWPIVPTVTPAAPTPSRHWGRREWVAAAGTLLFVLAVGGWLWHQANAGLDRIEGELQTAVDADQWRAERARRTESRRIGVIQDIAEKGQLPGAAHVQLLDLGEEWAIVQATTMQGELSYRQTRLYRRDANGWYAAAPSAALWGAPRTLEATYFIFDYYALDAEAVAQAAVKLDAFYPDLAASYPLDATRNGDGKRRIRVSPEYSLDAPIHRPADAALEIASPALYLAPTELSEGDILAQAVLLELLDALADQSLERQFLDGSHTDRARSQVNALLAGLRLWQIWSTELPLAALHQPTIQWIYRDAQGERTLPEFDAELCSLHPLWRAAPYAVQMPLFCGDPQRLSRYEIGRYLPSFPPRSLAKIHLFTAPMPDEPQRGLVEAELVGLATVFDYAATTYGRQSLATLIAAAAVHSTWETLIPAVFGVSYSDFESGWQAHLRSRYGVSVP